MALVRYPFAPRFAPRILAGTITETFRMPARRHVRSGEAFQLVDDVRFSPILKVNPICVDVQRCEVIWAGNHITTVRLGGVSILHLDRLAIGLGYDDLEDMQEDFARLFRPGYMEGFVIEWAPPSVAAAREVA